jgi:hypothetical protein
MQPATGGLVHIMALVFRAIVVLIWLMSVIRFIMSELRRRSALEEMIEQNATQKLFRQ